jgi:eukaryotic-like serine/threonine-protein kinase
MFIAHSKNPWYMLIAWCLLFLFSACSNTPISRPVKTQQTGTVPTLSSLATSSLLTSSCPAHPAIMPALPTGSHPNIIYLSERGGLQTSMTDAQLIRYDIITKSKTMILSLVRSDEEISEAQISTDGQWILFLSGSISDNQTRLQLIRADGQMLQTLFCVPANEMSNIRWSPDSQHVAFAVSAPNGRVSTIQILDLTTTQQAVFTASNYRPYAWLDNTRLYVIQPQGNQLTSPQNLSLLDTSQEHTQQAVRFTPIASANALCGAFEKSTDSKQLFTSSCSPINGNGCRGPVTQGPSKLSVEPAIGGPTRTIYHSPDQAIMALHPINSQTLLIYIENTSGNLSQNGLWKINTDGSSLTRVTTVAGQQCEDLGYPATYPQIISSGQYYALRSTNSTSLNSSLQVGSLNGGTPTTFETKNIREGVLILVGMVIS